MAKKLLITTNPSASGLSPVTSGLLCWLDGRDGSGSQTTWTDKSGNGNHATLHNFNFSTDGWSGKALKTDNANKSFVKGMNYLLTSATSELTLSLYFYDYHVYTNEGAMLGIWGDFAPWHLIIARKIGNGRIEVAGSSARYTNNTLSYGVAGIKHLVLVKKGTNQILVYLNGIEILNYTHGTNFGTSSIGFLSIAGQSTSATITTSSISHSLKMDIYTCMLYNRALTPSEIAQNYAYEQSITRG